MKVEIKFTNEVGNNIVVHSSISSGKFFTEVKLGMIGPTSKTEWLMTKEEAKVLKIALDSVLKTPELLS